MSTLRNLRDSGGPKGAARTPNTFGAVLRVSTAIEEGGALKLTGTVVTDVPGLGEGREVAIVFRGDDADRAVNNFIKGNGGRKSLAQPDSAAGAHLTLESCYLTEDTQGDLPVISSRWLNTLQAANKEEHGNRSVLEAVFATSPRVQFDNPDYRDGLEEPKTITMPVSQDKFIARVVTEHGTFNREFDRSYGVEKLKRLGKDAKPSVFIDMIEPKAAVLVTSEAELTSVLTNQINRGTRSLSLLRVTDGEEIVDRMVYGSYKKADSGEYKPDPQRTLEDLLKNNVFRDIANADLFKGLADGTLKVEAIPGYRLNYAGNPNQDDNAAYKLVQDLTNDKTVRYEMMFGKEPGRFASVLLPGLDRTGDIAGFSPINVIADRPGRYTAKEIVTPLLDPKSLKATVEEPAEAPAP